MNADSEKMEPMEWAKFVLRNRNEKGYARAYNIFVTRAREGEPKDYDAALSWFQKAHDGGNRGATYFLGKMYATGVGVQKDSRAAERMFLKCADEDVRAQYEIGLLYFRDEDIPRDLERSAKWMLRAANNGHAEAQFMVGQFYKAGAGVPKDMGKAVEWLTSAALNRHKGAQILLGNMYRVGDGVEADSGYSVFLSHIHVHMHMHIHTHNHVHKNRTCEETRCDERKGRALRPCFDRFT